MPTPKLKLKPTTKKPSTAELNKYENWRIRTLKLAAEEVDDITSLAPPPPVANALQSIILYCTNPAKNENKEYRMRILPHDNGFYFVEAEHGARGAKLRKIMKVQNVSFRQAQSVYDSIEREKRKEGYTTNRSGRV